MAEILIVLLGTTMIYLFAVGRLEGFVRTLALQGLLLFLLVLTQELPPVRGGWANLVLPVFETLVMKTILLPLLLLRIIRRNDIHRELEPNISQFYSVLIATGIFVFGFVAAFWVRRSSPELQGLFFGMSVSIIVASLVLILARKRIVTHILCFMALENGIFLLSVGVASEMPVLVGLGVLLDLFIAVFLLVVFFNKIRDMFDGDHIDVLSDLKDRV